MKSVLLVKRATDIVLAGAAFDPGVPHHAADRAADPHDLARSRRFSARFAAV